MEIMDHQFILILLVNMYYSLQCNKVTSDTWLYIAEPVELNGEGEYNLNVLKEIKTTESFLGLDESARGCENQEPFVCSTTKYVDTFQGRCGCLPLNMKLENNEVGMKKGYKL